jgi:glycosyltransferase involved in cell wall biosynthesis
VVVPVFNEETNVKRLVRGIVEAVRPLGLHFEAILVDDGSTDRTSAILRDAVRENPELVVITLRRNFGQTAALQAGLDRAAGDVIVTMDGDLQNDPRDIPLLLNKLAEGADVVSGWRRNRQDTLLLRKIPSWIANRLIRWVTGVPIHDQGCSLKAYRREVVQGLDLYADMHRFIAILTMPLGASIQEIEVHHHPRTSGESKYGISRVLKVLADLLTIQMLTPFREKPLRWFALLGLPFLAGALGAGLLALWCWPESLVLSTVAVLMGTTFVSCLLFGLMGEAIIEAAGIDRGRRVVFRELTEDT